jgi:hypothetical protein
MLPHPVAVRMCEACIPQWQHMKTIPALYILSPWHTRAASSFSAVHHAPAASLDLILVHSTYSISTTAFFSVMNYLMSTQVHTHLLRRHLLPGLLSFHVDTNSASHQDHFWVRTYSELSGLPMHGFSTWRAQASVRNVDPSPLSLYGMVLLWLLAENTSFHLSAPQHY